MLDARKILVLVNGNSTDAAMIALAAQTAKRNKVQVYAIHVIEVPRTLPLDHDLVEQRRSADVILDEAERTAAEAGLELETEILQARDVGTAVVEEAIEAQVDLVMLGIPYRKKFGDLDLGKTVPYVLKNVPCNVWVYRERMPDR
jgi:nucleotide-binding universal stress UspA family protein